MTLRIGVDLAKPFRTLVFGSQTDNGGHVFKDLGA